MKWMMMGLLASLPLMALAQGSAPAASGSSAVAASPQGQLTKREHVQKAFDACKQTAKPGHVDFQKCMETKGFKRPEPPAELKSAIEECKKAGPRASSEFRACMEKKGFARKKSG